MTTLPALPGATVPVILPVYNAAGYLATSVESVLAQSYRDLHVVIIDDASTDQSLQEARTYQAQFPDRITVIAKPVRRGVAHSINLGLSLTSQAAHVAIQNHDDIWLPEKLERQMAQFARHPDLGFVATEAAIIDDDGARTGQLFSDIFGRPDLANPARRIFIEGNCFCNASVVASRRGLDLLSPYSPDDGGCGDMYMWLTISAHLPVGWIDEPLTLYRRGPGQMTNRRSRQMWRETYALRDRALRADSTLREVVGGEPARRRLDGDALYRAVLYLEHGDLESYAWFARQVLRRRRARLAARLLYYTCAALIRSGRRMALRPRRTT